jgi:hypothetical protein
MILKHLLAVLIAILFQVSLHAQNLSISETISYINELCEEKNPYYPVFQLRNIEDGVLYVETYFCGEYEYNYLYFNKEKHTENTGSCGEDMDEDLWYVKHGIILEQFLHAETSQYNDKTFEIKRSTAILNAIGIKPNQSWDADDCIFYHTYNFKTGIYDENGSSVLNSTFPLFFQGDGYSRDKLINALDHLFTLIANNPAVYKRNAKDSDPFAPHNYNDN